MLPGQNDSALSSGIWDGKLNYKAEIDATQQDTTEAQNPINNTKEDKQKTFSIRVEVNKLATGQNPLEVHKALSESLGQKAYFFIGGSPIDKSYYFLKSVELRYSNIDISRNGSPYRAEIMLEFVEDVVMRVEQEKAKETTTKDGKKTASKVSPSKAAKKAEAKIWD